MTSAFLKSSALSSSLLVFISITAALHELTPDFNLEFVTGIALLLFVVIVFRSISFLAKFLTIISLSTFGLVVQFGNFDLDLLAAAIRSGAFLAFFLVAVNILRDAAETSPLIRNCGEIIVNQPPGRRYFMLTIGSNLFGVFLSLGAVNLLMTTVYRSIYKTDQPSELPKDYEWFQLVRLRRMTMAVTRGICAVPLWAPTSVTIAILLARFDTLTWFDLLAFGLPGAAFMLLLGWFMDRVTYRPMLPALTGKTFRPGWVAIQFASLMSIAALIPIFGGVLASIFDIRFIVGLLICMPMIGFGWIVAQKIRSSIVEATGAGLRTIVSRTFPALSDLRSEVAIFACSGFLAVLLIPQINIVWLSEIVSTYDLGQGEVLLICSWVAIVLAFLGLSPVFTVTLSAELLPNITGLYISPLFAVFVLTVTWGVVAGISPISGSTQLAAKCIRQSPFVVGPQWNFTYSLIIMSAMTGLLLSVN